MLAKLKKLLFNGKVNPFVRYFLIFVAGVLVAIGVLPISEALNFVELAGGLITGLGAVVWYIYSVSRKALLEKLDKETDPEETMPV